MLLPVLVAVPVLLGLGLKIASAAPQRGVESGRATQAFFNQLAGNGVFLTELKFALQALLILVLPLVVAVVAGDSIAGEAGDGGRCATC